MEQHLKLKIDNHIPHLFFTPKDGEEKKLTQKKEDISKVILNIGENFNLIEKDLDEDVQVNKLVQLANEADPDYLESMPSDIDTESLEFELEDIIQKMILEAKGIEKEYSDVDDMTQELRDEIDRNQSMDIMAGLLDTVYKVIVAKTLLAAYELEIDKVHFVSSNNYPRLTEKLGEELDRLGIELYLD
ncbi:MAG: hypothetical protein ABI721_01695 [Candidatus Dojkabacteria bacterium]